MRSDSPSIYIFYIFYIYIYIIYIYIFAVPAGLINGWLATFYVSNRCLSCLSAAPIDIPLDRHPNIIDRLNRGGGGLGGVT